MKNLYVVILNGGDGSFYPQYTFNKEWIDKIEKICNSRNWDYENILESYLDGDGFHYSTLTVPDECTLESLGISHDVAEDD